MNPDLERAMLPDICTEDVLAKHLGVSIRRVRVWFESGELCGRKLDGVWYAGRLSLIAQMSNSKDMLTGLEALLRRESPDRRTTPHTPTVKVT